MLKHLVLSVVVAVAMTTNGNSVFAAHIVAPPVTTTGPEFNPDFAASNLFDGAVTDTDLNITEYGIGDTQWAGPGEGPHELFMDFGASISTTHIAYSQRAGNDPVADKIGTIEFWFSDSDFDSAFPADPPDTTATITNTTDTVLTTYGLGGLFSGQYVAARFNAASSDPPTNNPGGSEMRFLAVPEPSGMLVASLVAVISGLQSIRHRESH